MYLSCTICRNVITAHIHACSSLTYTKYPIPSVTLALPQTIYTTSVCAVNENGLKSFWQCFICNRFSVLSFYSSILFLVQVKIKSVSQSRICDSLFEIILALMEEIVVVEHWHVIKSNNSISEMQKWCINGNEQQQQYRYNRCGIKYVCPFYW